MSLRFQAIRNVHPNVVSVYDETNAKDANGDPVALNESAISAEITSLTNAETAAATARTNNKTSGRDKLVALGLTTDELDAMGL